MFRHGEITRWEWKIVCRTSLGTHVTDWRATEESAKAFAAGKDVVSIEYVEHVLDY